MVVRLVGVKLGNPFDLDLRQSCDVFFCDFSKQMTNVGL